MLLNGNIVLIEKSDAIFFLALVVDKISGLFLHQSIVSFKDSRPVYISNGALPDF